VEDWELYQTIFGLRAPWMVELVELREAVHAVDVWVREAARTVFWCPLCGAATPLYFRVERRWRHLDTCQFTTRLCGLVPRVQCPTYGVKTVRVPWAERGSRFTLLFERLAIV